MVVSYDSNGRLAGIGRSDLSMSDGETKSVNVKVNTQNANVSAFVWDSVAAMKPLSEKKKAV